MQGYGTFLEMCALMMYIKGTVANKRALHNNT